MRPFAALLAFALAAWPQPPQPPIRDSHPFQSSIEITTIASADGQLVHGLGATRSNYEDGELQTITQFTSERVPIGLGVLLDISDSMFGKRIEDARAAVERSCSSCSTRPTNSS